MCVLEQTVSQSMGKLGLSRFAHFGETCSRSDIEQPWNGGSQGGLVKNQSDVQDATLSSSNSGSTFAYLVAGLGIGAAMSILFGSKIRGRDSTVDCEQVLGWLRYGQ